jgi:choline dehydrogenase-like flavoprotein
VIEDLENIPSGSTLDVDLCIIGAGAVGISLALQFIGSGLRVVLAESGGMDEVPETQDLYRGEVANDALHSPSHQYRHRLFGGSTLTWGGRCIPFDPIDFEARSWIPHSGWPISYNDVAPYYPAANAIAEAGDFIFSAEKAVKGGMRPIAKGFNPKDFSSDPLERFSCPTNFGARYGHRLAAAKDVRVLMHANCVEVIPGKEGGASDQAVFRTLSGKQITVTAKSTVVATGGIETARLFLASRRDNPNGVGNANDLVGRYYMCHIAGTIGAVKFNIPAGDIYHGYERSWDGVYCRRRMALKPEAQRREKVGNAVFRLHHPRLADPSHKTGVLSLIYLAKPFISYEYSKRLHGDEAPGAKEYLQHVLNLATTPFSTAKFLANWAWVRTLAARKFPSLIVVPRSKTYSIDVHSEQMPNPDSRIMLGNAHDALDMPRVRIDWRYTPLDIRTVSEGLRLLQGEFAAWGGAELTYKPEEVEHCMLREGAYGGHHVGTARMGRTPQEGVVDSNCRVFGTAGLYVAGSSVFPTSGQANPTLTAIAMTLRLADHLKQRLGAGRVA